MASAEKRAYSGRYMVHAFREVQGQRPWSGTNPALEVGVRLTNKYMIFAWKLNRYIFLCNQLQCWYTFYNFSEVWYAVQNLTGRLSPAYIPWQCNNLSPWCKHYILRFYFITYFYAPISTIVSKVLWPSIISLQTSVTITFNPPLRASATTFKL